jgi:predicted porin
MGRHDTPYKLGTGKLDIFGDTIADYNGGAQGGGLDGMDILMKAHDARVGQALAYISPTWSGFHFAVAGVMDEETAPGVGTGLGSGDFFDALSATGVYVNGPLFATLSYQSVEALDSDAWKVGAAYTFGDTTVGAAYENVETGSVESASSRPSVRPSAGRIASAMPLRRQRSCTCARP